MTITDSGVRQAWAEIPTVLHTWGIWPSGGLFSSLSPLFPCMKNGDNPFVAQFESIKWSMQVVYKQSVYNMYGKHTLQKC